MRDPTRGGRGAGRPPSCPCSSHWGSIKHWRPFRIGCATARNCSLSSWVSIHQRGELSWLAHGLHPIQPEEFEPSQRGWQHEAASCVEWAHQETQLFPRMSDPAKVLVRSHGGLGAGLALLTCPTCRLTKLDPHLFRVVLFRRLQMPFPPNVCSCRCGHLLDSFGHHRAVCARAGVLGKRGCRQRIAIECRRPVGH